MEKVMTNGFCELNEQEMMETEGGGWFSMWYDIGAAVYDYTHGGDDGGNKGIVPDPNKFSDYRCI